MKTIINACLVFIAMLCISSCFKTKIIYYAPVGPSASKMGGMRLWHVSEKTAYGSSIVNLPDSSFALVIIDDSTLRLPGPGLLSTVNITYYPYYSSSLGERDFEGDSAGYEVQVNYTLKTNSIYLTLGNADSLGNYNEYYFQSVP